MLVNYNRFAPYDLFDVHGHDLGRRRIRDFYKGHDVTAKWLLDTGSVLVRTYSLAITPKANDEAILRRGPALGWDRVLHELGTEAIDRAVRDWYRENRAKVHEAMCFPFVDYVHSVWHGMNIYRQPFHPHVYALARHFVSLIPRGAPILGCNRFWWTLRLRRIMLDEYKRDIRPKRRAAYLTPLEAPEHAAPSTENVETNKAG